MALSSKPPAPKRETSIDWIDYSNHLRKTYGKDFRAHEAGIREWMIGREISNGCFVTVEAEANEEDDEREPAVTWLASRLFADYPEVAKESKYNEIRLWVWW